MNAPFLEHDGSLDAGRVHPGQGRDDVQELQQKHGEVRTRTIVSYGLNTLKDLDTGTDYAKIRSRDPSHSLCIVNMFYTVKWSYWV